MHQAKYGKLIRVLLFNGIFLVILLILTEVFFGNWFNTNNIIRLNIVRNQNVRFDLQGLYPSKDKYSIYTRDQWGFRGNYPSVSNIDILTIGGSTTDQRFVSDGLTFQDVLQKRFMNNGKVIYVVNAGVDGQSTYGLIKDFEWWFPSVPGLKVKYFLFFIGVNDFYLLDEVEKFDDLMLKKKSFLTKLNFLIENRSALYSLYRNMKGMFLAHTYGIDHKPEKFSTDDWTDQPKLSDYEETIRPSLNAYEQRLLILCDNVKSLKAKPIFVTQSARRNYTWIGNRLYGKPVAGVLNGYPFSGVDYYHLMRLVNNKTMEICRRCGGLCIDLDAELNFDIKNDFYDQCHVTPSGAEKIGNYLYDKLKNLSS